MDNESYQDKIDYTVLVFVDTGTQTKRKVRSALCSYLIYCSNHFMTRFDSNAACIFAICVWYLYKINKNSTNYSPKSSACGGQVSLRNGFGFWKTKRFYYWNTYWGNHWGILSTYAISNKFHVDIIGIYSYLLSEAIKLVGNTIILVYQPVVGPTVA